MSEKFHHDYIPGSSDYPIHRSPSRQGEGGIIRRKKAEVVDGRTGEKIMTGKLPIHHIEQVVTAKQNYDDLLRGEIAGEGNPEDELELAQELSAEDNDGTALPAHLAYLENDKILPPVVGGRVPRDLTGQKKFPPMGRKSYWEENPGVRPDESTVEKHPSQSSVETEPVSVATNFYRNGGVVYDKSKRGHRFGHKPMSHQDYHEAKVRVGERLARKSGEELASDEVEDLEGVFARRNGSLPDLVKKTKKRKEKIDFEDETPVGTMQSSREISPLRPDQDSNQYGRIRKHSDPLYRGHRAGYKRETPRTTYYRDERALDRQFKKNKARVKNRELPDVQFEPLNIDMGRVGRLSDITPRQIIPEMYTKNGGERYKNTIEVIEGRLRDFCSRPEFEKAILDTCRAISDFAKRNENLLLVQSRQRNFSMGSPNSAVKKFLQHLVLWSFEIYHPSSLIGRRGDGEARRESKKVADEVESYLSDAIMKGVVGESNAWSRDSEIYNDYYRNVIQKVSRIVEEMSYTYIGDVENKRQAAE